MQYENTPIKNNTVEASKKMLLMAANRLSTGRLLWLLVTRHKVGILLAGNTILVLNFVFPPWFSMLIATVR